MSPEARERSFDELARGLASGEVSRGKALRLMGAALVGGTLASLGIGEAAADLCKRNGKACKKNSQCCSGICDEATDTCAPPECQDASDCDDGDPCTDDLCINGMCVNTPKTCDDGDPCTDDLCIDGFCVHRQKNCDDNNECTADVCIDGMCVHFPNEEPPCGPG
jgi:hypothetical protein